MHQTEDIGGLRQEKHARALGIPLWSSTFRESLRKVHLQCGKAVSVDDLIALGYIGFLQIQVSITGKFSGGGDGHTVEHAARW